MEGPSTTTTTATTDSNNSSTSKMVETDSQQQLPSGAPPVVPERDESTTTNPSMNGLEAQPFMSTTIDAPGLEDNSPGDSAVVSITNGTQPELETAVTAIASTSTSSSTACPHANATDNSTSQQPPNTAANTQPGTVQVLSMDDDEGSCSGASKSEGVEGKDEGEEEEMQGDVAKEADGGEKRVGCAHYKRRAKFVTPCCNKLYMCRYCHDEHETHYFNRKTVSELICTECDTRQRVQAECEKCGVRFGKYTCLVCNLFDDEDKNQYHCDGCGICRIGGKDRFFHCEVCNMCLPMQLKIDGHRCVENVSRSNCPVCLEDIHTSRIPCHIPDCGHLLHRTCFEDLLSSGHYACPTCQTSMIDMKKLWDYLDAEVENTPMPTEYANHFVNILCKDCHKESKITYHVVGLKCAHCGAYNTCQTGTGANEGLDNEEEADAEGGEGEQEGEEAPAADGEGEGNADEAETPAQPSSAEPSS